MVRCKRVSKCKICKWKTRHKSTVLHSHVPRWLGMNNVQPVYWSHRFAVLSLYQTLEWLSGLGLWKPHQSFYCHLYERVNFFSCKIKVIMQDKVKCEVMWRTEASCHSSYADGVRWDHSLLVHKHFVENTNNTFLMSPLSNARRLFSTSLRHSGSK